MSRRPRTQQKQSNAATRDVDLPRTTKQLTLHALHGSSAQRCVATRMWRRTRVVFHGHQSILRVSGARCRFDHALPTSRTAT
jgi:hypothetical protein